MTKKIIVTVILSLLLITQFALANVSEELEFDIPTEITDVDMQAILNESNDPYLIRYEDNTSNSKYATRGIIDFPNLLIGDIYFSGSLTATFKAKNIAIDPLDSVTGWIQMYRIDYNGIWRPCSSPVTFSESNMPPNVEMTLASVFHYKGPSDEMAAIVEIHTVEGGIPKMARKGKIYP